jgi:hypothetical protein
MRRIGVFALFLAFCMAWGIGCSSTEPENPEAKNNRLKNLAEKSKDKGKAKNPMAEN